MKKLWLTVLVLSLPGASCLAQYKVTTVDFPGAPQTELIAVNNLGQYVGALIEADINQTNHAIFFDGRHFRQLDPNGVLGSTSSFALSLNLRGDIVGGYIDASNVGHGFLCNEGKVTTIDFPGATSTFAFGINDKRQIIGIYNDTTGAQHAFLLEEGVFKNSDLPGGVSTTPFSINNRGEIVGEFENAPLTVGHGYFEARDGKVTTFDAPGAEPNGTFFISINNFNTILGSFTGTDNLNHNFVLTDGRLRSFDLPQSLQASAVSVQTINDFGEIVGFYNDPQGIQHGFVAIRRDDDRDDRESEQR
jgi:probable HAF family extracellular repeat protein